MPSPLTGSYRYCTRTFHLCEYSFQIIQVPIIPSHRRNIFKFQLEKKYRFLCTEYKKITLTFRLYYNYLVFVIYIFFYKGSYLSKSLIPNSTFLCLFYSVLDHFFVTTVYRMNILNVCTYVNTLFPIYLYFYFIFYTQLLLR